MDRREFSLTAMAVIALGAASRIFPLGWIVYDKYLGDALYAIAIYLALGLFDPNAQPRNRAILALALSVAIECFQLTRIPYRLGRTGKLPLELLAVVLGTAFGWLDLVAYLVGVVAIYLWESYRVRSRRG